MFNVDITGFFEGAFPSSIPIPARIYTSAVDFYKTKLRARQVHPKRRGSTTLKSDYGFRLHIYSISSSRSTDAAVRLQLPPSVNRHKVAKGLAAGASVKSTTGGLRVTDPYGVTWTLP